MAHDVSTTVNEDEEALLGSSSSSSTTKKKKQGAPQFSTSTALQAWKGLRIVALSGLFVFVGRSFIVLAAPLCIDCIHVCEKKAAPSYLSSYCLLSTCHLSRQARCSFSQTATFSGRGIFLIQCYFASWACQRAVGRLGFWFSWDTLRFVVVGIVYRYR